MMSWGDEKGEGMAGSKRRSEGVSKKSTLTRLVLSKDKLAKSTLGC